MTANLASMVGKKAAKSAFASHIAGIEPQDPLYEYTTDERGRQKRVRREVPPGLSKRDVKLLKKIKKRAHYLDKGISLCGFRVGWTFWIGLIPGAGDIIDALLNYTLVIVPAKKCEIPSWLLTQMLTNNAISAGVGLIPLLGDVVLAVWKANSRNAHLLEEYMAIRGQEYLAHIGANPPGSTTNGMTLHDPALQTQYKPGAGIQPGEVILPPGAAPQNTGRGGFIGGLLGTKKAQGPVTGYGAA